ncbi:MAG: tRNA preQ1(34) S-adenosylmethionine ribosyltransferase-isomerase QueA [Pyrinomonadaceae bacterium]
MTVSIEEYAFELPAELIANEPLEVRSASRMLTVDRTAESFDDARFDELPQFLRRGDVLVLNNTRVFPARLIGMSSTGARVEIFLIERTGENRWKALAKPAKRLSAGKSVKFSDELSAVVEGRADDGSVVLEFQCTGDLDDAIDRVGRTPFPPYIKRPENLPDGDRERYQTVYAKQRGAIAAPTAGLHFTSEILAALENAGVVIAEITLHVGYGTFEPIRVDDLSRHSVQPERYTIDPATSDLLNAARSDRRRIIAVGTTSTRALESNYKKHGNFTPASELASLTILPGTNISSIDGMITNFHLPKSSLLVLVSSFAGRDLIMRAYKHAVEERYRFYSYGDCMLIL